MVYVSVMPITENPSETPSGSPPGRKAHFIQRCIHGQAALWKVYWLAGVVGSWVLATIVINLIHFGLFPPLLGIAVLLAYGIWAAISIWRCAFNTAWRGWGYAARAVIVLTGLLAIIELIRGLIGA